MERGRILILGNSKETTYEIRSLLDNHRYELEIALSPEVGKLVLDTRKMNLIMIHSEVLQENDMEFLEYLKHRDYKIPVVVMGDRVEALVGARLKQDLHCFAKPYQTHDVISYIQGL